MRGRLVPISHLFSGFWVKLLCQGTIGSTLQLPETHPEHSMFILFPALPRGRTIFTMKELWLITSRDSFTFWMPMLEPGLSQNSLTHRSTEQNENTIHLIWPKKIKGVGPNWPQETPPNSDCDQGALQRIRDSKSILIHLQQYCQFTEWVNLLSLDSTWHTYYYHSKCWQTLCLRLPLCSTALSVTWILSLRSNYFWDLKHFTWERKKERRYK